MASVGGHGYVVRRDNRPPIAVKRRNLSASKYIVADKGDTVEKIGAPT